MHLLRQHSNSTQTPQDGPCRVTQIRAISARAGQAVFLLRKLVEGNLGRLALRLDDAWRARLLALQLRSFICTPDGDAVAAQLISLLVTKHLSASGVPCLPMQSAHCICRAETSSLNGAQRF